MKKKKKKTMTSQIEIIRSTKYTPVYEKGIKEVN